MNTRGHIGVSLIVFAPVLFITLYLEMYFFALLGLLTVPTLASFMIPDMDKNIPFIRHRKHTHTIWAAALVGLLIAPVFYVAQPLLLFALGLLSDIFSTTSISTFVNAALDQARETGAISFALYGFYYGAHDTLAHMTADSFTKMRIQPLYPFKKTRRGLGVINWDDTLPNSGAFVIGCILMLLAVTVPFTI